MKTMACIAGLAVLAMTQPALAHTRQKPPTTQTPQFEATAINPLLQRLNAMQQKLDDLQDQAGKQVVVLHFTPTELPGWLDNDANLNPQRATDLCLETLSDRFGRMISYRVRVNGDRFYFSHVVCETAI